MINLVHLNNFYHNDIVPMRSKRKRRTVVYSLVARYGPQSVNAPYDETVFQGERLGKVCAQRDGRKSEVRRVRDRQTYLHRIMRSGDGETTSGGEWATNSCSGHEEGMNH